MDQTNASRQYLSKLFWQAYDEAAIQFTIRKFISGEARSSMILGEGFHFVCLNLPGVVLDLVVKVAKAEALTGGINTLPSNWPSAMERLKTISSPLIPPMRHLHYANREILVMPKGKQKASNFPSTLQDQLSEFNELLSQHDLILDDYPQVLYWHDLPFICDWSDLTIIDGRNNERKQNEKRRTV